MLKIKNDVNLAKLKEFGFRFDERRKMYYKLNDPNADAEDLYNSRWIVWVPSREIMTHGCVPLEVFFDLTQAGLVEKGEPKDVKLSSSTLLKYSTFVMDDRDDR